MSVIKVNNITNKSGTSGPVIAGITTVSSSSHFVVPVGDTRTRDPELIISGLTFHIDAGISSSYSGIGTQVNNIGSAGLAYTGFWQGKSSTGSPVIYSQEEGGGSWFLEGNGTTIGENNFLRVGAAGTSGAGIGNTTALGVGSSLTVSIWHYPVRLGGSVSGNNYMLFNNHFQGGGPVSGLVVNSDNNGIDITFQTRFNNTCCQTQTSSTGTKYSGWQNHTFTWDSLIKRIYLNGNEIVATQSATGTNQMLNALYFGVNADTHAGSGNNAAELLAYRGYLSKVMIYNRAITETEIHQNYAAVKNRYTGIR